MRSIKGRLKSLQNIKRRSFIINLLPLVFAAVVYLLVKLAVKNPAKVETIYFQGVYPVIGSPLSWISSLVPFSIWDIFWTLLIVVIIAGLVAVVMRKLNVLKYILRLIQSIAIMYSAFYILWGFNYFRQDISTRLSWEKNKPDEIVFRRILDDLFFRRKYYFGLQNKTLEKVAEAANDAYLKANHIKAGVKNYDQVVSLAIRWYENPK